MNDNSSEKRDIKRRKLRKITEFSAGIPILAICLLVSPLLNGFTTDFDQVNFSSVISIFWHLGNFYNISDFYGALTYKRCG